MLATAGIQETNIDGASCNGASDPGLAQADSRSGMAVIACRQSDLQPIGTGAVSGPMPFASQFSSSVPTPCWRGWILLLAAITCLSGPATAAQNRCEDEVICVAAQEHDDGVDLLARNLASFPISVSLSTRARNLEAEPNSSVSRTLKPGETASLLRLAVSDSRASWSYRYWFDWSPGLIGAVHDDSYLYRLPYASGKSFRVLQGFGSRFSHGGKNRYAVDFKMPVGTPVHAARPGIVVDIEQRHNKGCWEDGCGRYANYIVVLHTDGTTGEYYHLMQDGARVAVGEHVRAGQWIGLSGNTGHTTMPHLHFAVYRPEPWGKFESLPFRFGSRDGVIDGPRSGRHYVAD